MPPPFDHAFVADLPAPYDRVYSEATTFLPASRLITDPLRLLTWGSDASFYRLVPKIVAVVESEDELVRLLALCARMLRNREPPLKIQFMLARQLRQIWRAKELAASGASRGDIAGAVGINPYFLDDIMVPARRMSRAALERALERLFQADLALKTSRVEPELALSRLVQSLAEAR